MKISVIVPTFRLGGIDLLKWTLDQQSLPHSDFELVLVDGLYQWRKDAVARFFAGSDYGVVHVPPEPDSDGPIFPRDCHPRYRNTGIKHASGDLCVLCCDYVMATPYWLAMFEHRSQTVGPNYAICGVHLYGKLPPSVVNPILFDKGEPPSLDYYRNLVECMASDNRLWTGAFLAHLSLEYIFALTQTSTLAYDLNRQDPKLRLLSGTMMTFNAFHMKNEAVRREHLLAVRGLDETYNDTKCADDLDVTLRLSQHGVKFVIDKGIDVLIPDPHAWTPELQRKRPYLDTLKEWQEERKPILVAGETQPRISML